MSKRPSNEKVWCFVCERTIPARDAEPVMRGDIVKQACKEHGLGLRSTKPKPDEKPIWTQFTGNCEFCKRDFHVSQQAIDEQRREFPSRTEEMAAADFTACMSCAAGRDFAGEHDFSTPKKRPTIVVTLSEGRVQAVVSDYPDEQSAPHVFVVDYDNQADADTYLRLDRPLDSIGQNIKSEEVRCEYWPLQEPDTAAIARLNSAFDELHKTDTAVPQPTPVTEWRAAEQDRVMAGFIDTIERIRQEPKQDDLAERVERVNVDDLSAFISDLYSEGDGELRDRHLEKLVRYVLTESERTVLTESERTEAAALPEWTLDDQRRAEGEGWCLFNYPDANTDLEKDDEAGRFVNDDEALISVARRARHGSAFHRKALVIWRGLNPTEYDAAMKAVGYPRVSPAVTAPATYPQGLLGECDDQPEASNAGL